MLLGHKLWGTDKKCFSPIAKGYDTLSVSHGVWVITQSTNLNLLICLLIMGQPDSGSYCYNFSIVSVINKNVLASKF